MTEKKILKIGDFTRSGSPGSFGHMFTHKLPDGGEICLESCFHGYCVGRYDEHLNLIGEKTCTNLEGMDLMQIAPGFSLGSGEALMKAVEIANTKI